MSADSYRKCPICNHPKDTLREGCEFYWKNCHTIIVSYSCTCDNCEFTYSFEHKSDINKEVE